MRREGPDRGRALAGGAISAAGRVPMLVVRPHPDDETIATGGMLLHYREQGVRTGLVTCTGGEEGEIHDPDLDPVADKPRLREIRERELREACAILGVAELRMLGFRDSGMVDTPGNHHPEAFCRADPVEAAARLVRIIRAWRPLVMVTEPEGGLYGHPDHIACHRVSVDAFHVAGDPRAHPETGPPWQIPKLYVVAQIDDGRWEALRPEFVAAGIETTFLDRRRERPPAAGPETATVALDVRPYTEDQRRALLAHRTQISPTSLWRRLPPELRRRAFATAYFRRLHPPVAAGEHEADLLQGLAGTGA